MQSEAVQHVDQRVQPELLDLSPKQCTHPGLGNLEDRSCLALGQSSLPNGRGNPNHPRIAADCAAWADEGMEKPVS